ncbi:hypothetical protein ACP70R_001294 [Stipagrostis hirtigluma subsp. patula]
MARATVTTAAMAIVALLAAAAASLPAAVADANFVAETCRSSDNPQCVAVLSTDPRSVNATTVHELASIGLDIATANARKSFDFVSDEASKRFASDYRDPLNECVSWYNSGIDDLSKARKSFDAGSYNGAEEHTSLAEDVGDHCEQAFTDRHLKSVVSDVDKRMKEWSSVASDLIDLLWTVKKSRRLLRA